MTPHVQTFREATDALAFFTGWAGGWHPFQRRREGAVRSFWRAAGAPGLADLASDLAGRYEDEVWMGLPQQRRFNGGVGRTTVLWCWSDGSAQLQRARKLRPFPSMVLQAGPVRLLVWGLEAPVSFVVAQEANRKLSYAIGGRQREGDPDQLWIPLPGTPVGKRIVWCPHLSTATFEVSDVAGRLREPPAKDAWRS